MIEPVLVGVFCIILLVILLIAGLPIAFSMMAAGIVGIFIISGPSGYFWAIGQIGFTATWGIGMLAIPAFVFMGVLITEMAWGQDLYDLAYKWLGWLPGGLAVASTAMSALFGFMCGSAAAGILTVGVLAVPEMEKRGYNRRLALGTLCLAGSLAVLIPPSALMIIYAVQAECSMGALFFAGIIPGILLAAVMSLYIIGRVIAKPSLAPKGPKARLCDKLRVLLKSGPLVLVGMSVLGSIYLGWASPIEAGTVGVFAVTLVSLAYQRATLTRLKSAIMRTTRICGMIYFIVIGGYIFSTLMYLSGFQELIQQWMLALPLAPWVIIVISLLILTVMGMFFDIISIVVISAPILVPIVTGLGYDVIWFGILMIMSCELALITPPVGFNLYIIHSIAPEGTKLMDVLLGAMPFVGLIWFVFGLLIVWPEIVLWLPSTM